MSFLEYSISINLLIMTTINITKKQGTLLIERCNKFTRDMLQGGMDINKVCMFVKDYKTKYLYIKQEGGDYTVFF